MDILFQHAKKVISSIDQYLDNIIKSILIFEQGINEYFNRRLDLFEDKFKESSLLESESDELRRSIKITLYRDLLIPESRGDVLGLLETLDNVIDVTEAVLKEFSIEKPEVVYNFKEDFLSLTELSAKSAKELVSASRAFFRDITKVHDYITQVHYWEHETDKIEERIKRAAFNSGKIEKLSYQVQVRYFAERISLLADTAEDVTERLEVYTIKRMV